MKNLLHNLLDLIEHATGLAVSADPAEQRTLADRVGELRDQVDGLDVPAAAAKAPENVVPEVDPRDAEIAALKAQLAALSAPAPAAETPAAPPPAAEVAPAP
jgi:hypothetical protein